jgi:hypothetical protein
MSQAPRRRWRWSKTRAICSALRVGASTSRRSLRPVPRNWNPAQRRPRPQPPDHPGHDPHDLRTVLDEQDQEPAPGAEVLPPHAHPSMGDERVVEPAGRVEPVPFRAQVGQPCVVVTSSMASVPKAGVTIIREPNGSGFLPGAKDAQARGARSHLPVGRSRRAGAGGRLQPPGGRRLDPSRYWRWRVLREPRGGLRDRHRPGGRGDRGADVGLRGALPGGRPAGPGQPDGAQRRAEGRTAPPTPTSSWPPRSSASWSTAGASSSATESPSRRRATSRWCSWASRRWGPSPSW